MAKLIDGKAFAKDLRGRIAGAVQELKTKHGFTPGLAVVLVGEDPASRVYVANKAKQTVEVGMNSWEHRLPASTSEADLLALVEKLNRDPACHGILVQLPLPKHIDSAKVLSAIDPAKDVDGFHVVNVGRLSTGQEALVACTPVGSVMLAKHTLGKLEGLEAVVIGRSNIVGKPVAQLLLAENCTVTIAHSKTRDLPGVVRRADLVIAAVGRPEMVKGDWLKPGACVIDVGINRIERDGKARLVGDCDFASCEKVAGAITPVPGGVGPMTIACLLHNTVKAACAIKGIATPAM
ncbi:MAG: bifunctional methylenetetrahydrofolate dehydrogenase/methenyltetrahydrofolate cyclohydrolase FolD [Rhizobiales bacterium]|nr:bifunctional methylenetetrahydrofolate dehydrogenase/methenyltetrahydrofolate cyclohydrolase FolD [Hyphomicrobiales bacterium]MBI3671940.1 bifunctional methylenetetrahydrofolate dehydrogenase/methenyltetrahydrofolate cyclohydrolase FolD [Hyphomicrobiales bacterium]